MAGKSSEWTLSRNLSVNLKAAGIRSKNKEKYIDFWKGKTCYELVIEKQSKSDPSKDHFTNKKLFDL